MTSAISSLNQGPTPNRASHSSNGNNQELVELHRRIGEQASSLPTQQSFTPNTETLLLRAKVEKLEAQNNNLEAHNSYLTACTDISFRKNKELLAKINELSTALRESLIRNQELAEENQHLHARISQSHSLAPQKRRKLTPPSSPQIHFSGPHRLTEWELTPSTQFPPYNLHLSKGGQNQTH